MAASANDIGLAFITLSLVFLGAALIRRWTSFLRRLFIPTALIGGFLALALGPEGVGRLTDSHGAFSPEIFGVWEVLPGLLINVMCASLLLGERLPHVSKIWDASSPHVIMAGVMSSGQYAVGCLLVIVLLRPLFDMPDEGGAMIEMSFAGGHGTLAGLNGVLVEHGVGELLDVGLGLATIGMVTGVVIGTVLVNYAVSSPSISVAGKIPHSPRKTWTSITTFPVRTILRSTSHAGWAS
jgi:ESS family glutamate:Na+ symporter